MFHAAALAQAVPILEQYFLNPAGLLALLALVPLLVIYLMRPEPEERVMPSMEFFMEKKRSGKMQKALRKLQRNLLLILHILFIGVLAAALAGPYVTGEETAEKTVVVVDRSASMADDLEKVQEFVEAHAGRQNTLVLADEEVTVPLEGADRQETVRRVGRGDARNVETDIRSGLEVARGYEGRILVASDLDQSVGSGGATDAVDNLRAAGREVVTMEASAGNQWGIVEVRAGRGNSTVDVKNFMEEDAEVHLTAGSASRTLEIPAGTVETVTVPTPAGRTAVELEGDAVPADDTAFISVPEDRSFKVLLISDSGNPHLEKAVELINFTSIETATPPLNQVPNADVYIVGRTDRILGSTVEDVETRVRDGASLIVFAQDGIFGKASSLPVERAGDRRNVTVEIQEPRRVLVGETPVFEVRRTRGESMANDNALVRGEHGNGEVVLYNIRDGDFHFDFLYPVFWKDLLEELTERPTVGERNLETGDEIDFSSVTLPSGEDAEGPVRAVEAGFYETSRGVYTANLVSPDESEEEEVAAETGVSEGAGLTDKPLKHYAAALLLLMVLGEFGYLRWRGSL